MMSAMHGNQCASAFSAAELNRLTCLTLNCLLGSMGPGQPRVGTSETPSLPLEVICQILRLLPARDVASAAATSKRW